MTPWVLRLLVANIAVFFLTQSGTLDWRHLALFPFAIQQQPWGVITYMFVHSGFWHLALNMMILFFFGPRLETQLGGKPFLGLYFLSGLGGAAFSFLFARDAAVIGASGAALGVLLGFAFFWPRDRIYIWGILPIEARWLVIIFAALDLSSGIFRPGDGTAHFAHLGGLAAAFLFLRWRRRKYLQQWTPMATPKSPMAKAASRRSEGASLRKWKSIRVEELHQINRDEVERLLQKAQDSGVRSLTQEERSVLDRFVTDH